MIRLALFLTLALTGLARAEMTLADLTGSWTGSGNYYEGISKAKMKCRLATSGNAAQIVMQGRCGSSLGANDVQLQFTRQGDGSIVMRWLDPTPSVETEIENLTGRFVGDTLRLAGEARIERASMTFAKGAGGALDFLAERKWRTGNSRSVVRLTPR